MKNEKLKCPNCEGIVDQLYLNIQRNRLECIMCVSCNSTPIPMEGHITNTMDVKIKDVKNN